MTPTRLLALLLALGALALALLASLPATAQESDSQGEGAPFTEEETGEFLEVVELALSRGHRAARAKSVAESVAAMTDRDRERVGKMLEAFRERSRTRDQRKLYARLLDAMVPADVDPAEDHRAGDAADPSALSPTARQTGLAGRYFAGGGASDDQLGAELDAVGALSKADAARWAKAALAACKPQLTASENVVRTGGVTMKYFVVGELKPGDPLFIYLHGGGANAQINERAWRSGTPLPQKFGFTAGVLPRVPDDSSVVGWREHSAVKGLIRLIDEMIATHGVDPDRVYIVGGSMGAWGISTLAPALADRVAAFCCHYGGGLEYRGFGFENLRNTPMIIGIGGADTQFNRLAGTRQMKGLLERLHQQDPDGFDFVYEEWPGVGHQWKPGVCERFGNLLRARQRPTAPKQVLWQPTRPFLTRFAWLERATVVTRPGQAVRAVIDGNTITLHGNARGLILNLNDDLVDLSQPVTVKTASGEVLHEGPVERRATHILASAAAVPDPSRIYSARIELP